MSNKRFHWNTVKFKKNGYEKDIAACLLERVIQDTATSERVFFITVLKENNSQFFFKN